jgi:hypothetical protein
LVSNTVSEIAKSQKARTYSVRALGGRAGPEDVTTFAHGIVFYGERELHAVPRRS